MKSRSWIVGGIGVAALAALAAWSLRPRAVVVEIRPAERARFEQTVDEEGRTRVRDRYTISAPAAGRIERIALRAGDAVAEGETVAILRPSLPTLHDTRTIAELRARVGAVAAELRRAHADVGRAIAALEQARFDAERTRKLAAQGFASKSAEDQARLALAQQEQALKAAESARHAASHELEQAKAALAHGEAGGSPGATITIRAPSPGRVLRVIQESEAAVSAGAPLVEIGDPRSLEAVIEVLSQDATRIRPGMPVRMTAAPGGPEIDGRVRLVEPGGHTKISTLGIEEQRVNVIADFDSPPADLGDGYHLDARIVVLARDGATVVPVGALFREGARWATFVVESDRALLRRVELGGRNARDAWVTGGIEPGTPVVVYPPDTVRDGTPVRGH